jgi:hypothetical protein
MTAVEWLIDRIDISSPFMISEDDIQKAIQMEKQQIIDAWHKGYDNQSPMIDEENCGQTYYNETYGSKGSDETLKDYHIVDTNEMVKRGTLKKRMDKDGWFVVFQSNAYNESDMAYELLKSQEIDIDMYDVYKDGDEITFEVVNKKWAKITPFLYPFKTTSSQTEISDEETEKAAENAWSDYEYEEGNLYSTTFKGGWDLAIRWYKEQLNKL